MYVQPESIEYGTLLHSITMTKQHTADIHETVLDHQSEIASAAIPVSAKVEAERQTKIVVWPCDVGSAIAISENTREIIESTSN